MATTIGDLKEMELEELCGLYKTIYQSFSNRHNGHDNRTLNLIRFIIEWKITGQAYMDYLEIVEEVGEGHFDSTNNTPVSYSEAFRVIRDKEDYGIGEELSIHNFNETIIEEVKTTEFLEEQETEEESKINIEYDKGRFSLL